MELQTKCEHCKGTGTCSMGKDGNSCYDCAKKSYSFSWLRRKATLESNKGLVCKQCEGSGLFDPKSKRLHQNSKPILAFFVVVFGLYVVFDLALKDNPHLNEILPFVSALAGGVIASYFPRNNEKNS